MKQDCRVHKNNRRIHFHFYTKFRRHAIVIRATTKGTHSILFLKCVLVKALHKVKPQVPLSLYHVCSHKLLSVLYVILIIKIHC